MHDHAFAVAAEGLKSEAAGHYRTNASKCRMRSRAWYTISRWQTGRTAPVRLFSFIFVISSCSQQQQ